MTTAGQPRAIPGPLSANLVERLALSECPSLTARRKRRAEQSGHSHDPVVWKHAQGVTVTDVDDQTFIDLSASFGTAALGHRHPRVEAALRDQLGRLWQGLGDMQPSEPKVRLLEKLAQLAPWPQARVMLGLSGSDSVEAALKTALLATGRPGVLAFHGGYHGLSYGALCACGYKPGFRQPFLEQLNREVHFAPYPGAQHSVDNTMQTLEYRCNDNIGAVIVEPVQARGGVHIPPSTFLPTLYQWCQQRDIVLIVDEIYTGLGRCGAWWLSAQESVYADVICIGKALGSGMPISACVGRYDVMQAWGDSRGEALHTSTFAGYPLGCVAALETLSVLEQEDLPTRALHTGELVLSAWRQQLIGHDQVRDIRGKGLLLGIEFHQPRLALVLHQRLLRAGFITLVAGRDSNVLQLSPALSIDSDLLCNQFANALAQELASL